MRIVEGNHVAKLVIEPVWGSAWSWYVATVESGSRRHVGLKAGEKKMLICPTDDGMGVAIRKLQRRLREGVRTGEGT